MQHSLNIKINVIIILVVTLIFVIFGAIESTLTYSRMKAEQELTLTNSIQRLAQQLTIPVFDYNHAQINRHILTEMQDQSIDAVIIWDAIDNTIISGKIREQEGSVTDFIPPAPEHLSGFFKKTVPIVRNDTELGTIELYFSRTLIRERIMTTIRDRLLTFAVLLVVTVVTLAIVISINILHPISALENTVKTIIPGDLEHVIDTSRHDEIGRLAKNFARMRDGIKTKIEDLAAKNRELAESEERFRMLIDQAADAVFVHDFEGRFLMVNQHACDSLGYSRAELMHLSVFDIESEYRSVEELQQLWHELTPDQPMTLEGRHTRKDGSTFPVEVRIGLLESRGRQAILGLVRDITERKQAEEQLRESEERFRNMMEQAPFAIAILTPAGRICQVNPAWRQLWGIPEDILPQLLEKFNILNDKQGRECGILPLIEKAFAGEAVTLPPIEYDVVSAMNDLEIANATGRKVWIQPHLYPLKGAHGEILNMVDMYDDITERKQAEEALRKDEEILEQIFATTNSMIAYMDREFNFIRVNRAYADAGGREPEDFIGENHFALYSHAENEAIFRHVVETGEPYIAAAKPFEYPDQPERGTTYWDWTLLPVREEQGEVTGLLLSLSDVTEQKRAELVLQQANIELENKVDERTRELSKAREWLQTIIDNVQSVVFAKDIEGRHLLVNSSFEKATGMSRQEIIGKTDEEIFPPDVARTLMQLDRSVMAEGTIFRAEEDVPHPDGTLHTYQSTKVPLFDQQSEVYAMVGTATDITELKKMEKHLREAKEAALEAKEAAEAAQRASEAANHAKSEFLANMSHELRTPMNAILGFAQLMQRDAALTDTQRDHLDTIMRSGEHLLKLINSVLNMSRIEAGQMRLNMTTVDLWHLLLNIEEMLRVRAETKGLQFALVRAPDVPRLICTDESKLRQILVNLLGNAVKFTEEGEITLRVTVKGERLKVEGKESAVQAFSLLPLALSLQFQISDTGIGIAADELDIIFDTFGRTQQSERTAEGSGLGLAISQKFVQLMGGDIQVESEVGKGSVFTFVIRVEVVGEAETSTENGGRRVIGLEPDQHTAKGYAAKGSPYRILIAEDTEDSRHLLSELLRTVGFEVQEAVNGQEALEKFTLWQPHLIWMDMRMPVMDGYEATKRIRELEQQEANGQSQEVKGDGRTESTLHLAPCSLHPVPIIALTASAFEEERARILEAGCNDVVRKPILEHEIFETIHKHIGVQYVYEETGRPKRQGNRQDVKKALTPEILATLPSKLLNSLEQAVAKGDVETIERIIDTIHPEHAAVAEAMTALTSEFKYHEIWTMLRQVRAGME